MITQKPSGHPATFGLDCDAPRGCSTGRLWRGAGAVSRQDWKNKDDALSDFELGRSRKPYMIYLYIYMFIHVVYVKLFSVDFRK